MDAEQLRSRITEIANTLRELHKELPSYKDDELRTAITHTKYMKLDAECVKLMMQLNTLEGKLT